MSFALRTLVRAAYTALLGLAMLGWLGAAAGAIEPQRNPQPPAIEPFDNPIPFLSLR